MNQQSQLNRVDQCECESDGASDTTERWEGACVGGRWRQRGLGHSVVVFPQGSRWVWGVPVVALQGGPTALMDQSPYQRLFDAATGLPAAFLGMPQGQGTNEKTPARLVVLLGCCDSRARCAMGSLV